VIRLVDAQFPNYRGAFNNYASVPDILIDASRLSQAMRQMMLLTCENAKNITMILESRLLTLKVSTPLGEGKTEIEVDYEGEAITVGINPQFVQDFLREVSSQNIENIRLKVIGARKPIIMSPHDDYVYFMSPISS
jgi:DNA polymerase III sliding clamp (beta) subunit (PCNA family)